MLSRSFTFTGFVLHSRSPPPTSPPLSAVSPKNYLAKPKEARQEGSPTLSYRPNRRNRRVLHNNRSPISVGSASMDEEQKTQTSHDRPAGDEEEEASEAVELVLFHVSECYVYLIPPRKSASSCRADEWDVNKWAWEGTLKVVSKGEECIIKLEDKSTGELYARAFLRKGEPHPVEPVTDSSRYFVLRVEENIGGRLRHAFIGIGFRERPQAYDFQAALHDHMKYLNKKKTAEEMEQHFQSTSSVDYSLKEGETLVLQLKNNGCRGSKSAFFEQGLNNLSLEEKANNKQAMISLKPLPPPPAPISSTCIIQKSTPTVETQPKEPSSPESKNDVEAVEDVFGDFQAAG